MRTLLERFPRLRVWGPIALGLLIALLVTLIYLQTRHGFRHVVVPVAALFLPGTLEVRDGLVDLPDTLQVEGLRYVDGRAGLELLAERASTVVSPLSLLGGGPPEIHALEVKDATLALTLPRKEAEPEAESAGESRGAGSVALLPLAVKEGRIDGLDVSVRAGEAITTVEGIVLTIDEAPPGGRSQLTLRTNWRHQHAGSGDTWSGVVDAGMTLSHSVTGDAFEWSGTADIGLREAPTLPPAAQAVTLRQAVEGSYDRSSGALRATSALQVEQGDASLASAKSEVTLGEETGTGALAASLTIERLTAAALNLALAGRAEAHFETADIKGRVDLRGAGERFSLQSSVHGEGIQLRLHDSQRTTPPIAFTVQQAALLDRSIPMLTLETLHATVSDHARPFLVAALDRPFAMYLDRHPAQLDTTAPEAEAAKLSVTLHELDVEKIRPWLALTGGKLLDEVRGGSLQGRLAATVRRQAETVEISAGLRAKDVVVETPLSRGRLGPLHLQQDLRATLTNLETLEIDEWKTNVIAGKKSVGGIRAAGTARLRPDIKVGTMSARLTFDELPAELLNPLLSGTGGPRIARARLSGTATVDVTEEQIVWDASYHGDQIRLAIPGAARPTAPTDIQLVQSGRYDRRSSVLTLPTLNIKVLEGRRVVLAGTLERPLTLDLARPEEGRPSPAQAAQPVRFRLDIQGLSVEQLRPRLALLGSRALDGVTSGVLDGRLKIDVLERGDSIEVAGRLDASDVRIGNAAPGPLAFRSSLEGTIAGATRVTLKTLVARTLAGPKELFLLQVSGSADTDRGAVNATVHAFSVDVTNALRRAGWLSEKGARMSEGGELSAKLQVVASAADQPLAVTGEAKVGNLRTVLGRNKALTGTVTAHLDLGVNGERTLVSLRKIDLGVEREGRPEGSLTLTGQWPLVNGAGSSLPPGRVTVKAGDLDVGPLIVLLDLVPGLAPGPLPVSIDATVSHDPSSQVTRIHGRESLGPLVLLRRRPAPPPTTVHLTHDLRFRGGEDIHVDELILTSERPRAAGDEVSLKGRLRLGAAPRLELRGNVARLDAAWYADLLSSPDDGERAKGNGAGEAKPGPGHADDGAWPLALPLDLDVDTSIGTVTYRTIVIGKGRLKGIGTGDRATLTLEPTGLAGGQVKGVLGLANKQDIPHLSWSAEGKDIELGPIMQAFLSPDQPQLRGRAAFTMTGKGRAGALKRSLSGGAVIDVTDGEFVQAKFLRYAAEQTGIEQYEGMKFNSLHGELELADGWLHVRRLAARGSGVAFDGTGKISLDGQLDAVVTPGMTGSFAEEVKGHCAAPLLRTVDEITTFPFAIKVSGTALEPKFTMTVTESGGAVGGVGGLPLRFFETLKNCGGFSKTGKESKGEGLDLLKGADKLFQGLTGPKGTPKREGSKK